MVVATFGRLMSGTDHRNAIWITGSEPEAFPTL